MSIAANFPELKAEGLRHRHQIGPNKTTSESDPDEP
jgi:hypothetical protein